MAIATYLIDNASLALENLLRFDAPADSTLQQYFRAHPLLGKNDRAFVAETVFAVLRRKRYLEHVAGKSDARALTVMALLKLNGYNIRDISQSLTESEVEWAQSLKKTQGDDAELKGIQTDFPDWLIARLAAHYDDAAMLTLARGLNQPAPLDLRVNLIKDTRDEVLAQMLKDGFEAAATPFAPCGIRLQGRPSIQHHSLFIKGVYEVQDEGSQLLAHLVAPKRGEMVVDFCAGAGGKTLALGAMMRSTGRLYAFDVSEKRLTRFGPRLKRSGLSNVHPQRIDSENDTKVKRLAKKIDRVLVDAPCSGLGTLRRNPDLKWRQQDNDIVELVAKQGRILHSASNMVKPGGRLIYGTCSILSEENEGVIEAFLAAHPDFSVVSATDVLAKQEIVLTPAMTGPYLKLLPHLHQTDGFFAAVLERAK